MGFYTLTIEQFYGMTVDDYYTLPILYSGAASGGPGAGMVPLLPVFGFFSFGGRRRKKR